MKACMGGWCAIRDRCPLYNAPDRRSPAERLCMPGMDGWLASTDVIDLPKPNYVIPMREQPRLPSERSIP